MTPHQSPSYRQTAGPVFATLLASLGTSIANIALPQMAAALQAPFATVPIVSAASGVPAGRIVDRFGTARVALLGVTLMAVAVGFIAMVAQSAGVWGYLVGVALLTQGYQMFLAANTTQVMVRAAPDQRGMLSGFLGLSRNLGLILGAAAMGALFARATGQATLTDATAAQISLGTSITFAATTVLLLAAVAVLRRP